MYYLTLLSHRFRITMSSCHHALHNILAVNQYHYLLIAVLTMPDKSVASINLVCSSKTDSATRASATPIAFSSPGLKSRQGPGSSHSIHTTFKTSSQKSSAASIPPLIRACRRTTRLRAVSNTVRSDRRGHVRITASLA